MARYIDADEIEYTSYPLDGGYVDTVFATKEEIDRQPTADVVEVVRCKDCKHWNRASRVTEHMGCDIFCGAYGREYPTLPEDFCSYGKRK